MSKRKAPTLRQKLAATLLMMVKPGPSGNMVPVIPFDEAKGLTAEQIIGRFDFDHGIFVAIGGGNDPWNLTPRLRAEHRAKTKRDVKEIAKVRRALKKRARKNCHATAARGGTPGERSTDEVTRKEILGSGLADETGEYARSWGETPHRALARSSAKSAKKTRPKIPGSKGTPYRKKINGTVERRV